MDISLSMRDVESNLSLYEDKLKFYFVSNADQEESETIIYAKEKLRENVCITNIKDISEEECLRIADNLNAKDVLIFDNFDGDGFLTLSQTKALILGPRCVISCLMDNVTIPNIRSPIYTLAMRNLLVCLTSFSTEDKKTFKRLINHMGGICIDQLTENVSHLVTDSVKTKKYEIAVMKGIKIMKSSWIHDVWAKCKEDNVLATNSQFDVHTVPTFYNLSITTTGLGKREKKEVQELVLANGGNYYGEYAGSKINIVIAKKDSQETPKLKAAIAANVDCLCVEWIFDSVAKGCALPLDKYRILIQSKKVTSTPEKRTPHNLSAMSVEYSHILVNATINETAMSISSQSSDNIGDGKENSLVMDSSFKTAFDQLSIQEAKKAGLFLDGCNIYFCGFTSSEKEKVCKILNAGGATRFDTITSNVSHILVGNPTKKDLLMLKQVKTDAVLVKLQWLVESIQQKTAVDSNHEHLLYRLNNGKPSEIADDAASAPSPASKRNIMSMSQSTKKVNRTRLDFDEPATTSKAANEKEGNDSLENVNANMEDLMIDQYLNPAAADTAASKVATKNDFKVPNPVAAPAQTFAAPIQTTLSNGSNDTDLESEYSSTMPELLDFLSNLKVFIYGFDEESHEYLSRDCINAGAEIIVDSNYKGIVDYMICALDVMSLSDVKIRAKNIVNHNWLVNAKKINTCTDIPYFHEPIIFVEELKPLANMTIVFSLYSGDERVYLLQLAEILGAEVRDSYKRAERPLLICPGPKSAKYDAAIKWHLTVVTCEWLKECHKRKKRIPLKKYLVGDSIAPVDDVEDEDEDLEEIVNSQFPDNGPIEAMANVPAAYNRRVEQLRGGPSTPGIPGVPACAAHLISSPINYCERNLNMMDTPTREQVKQIMEEMEKDTPQTKRRRKEEAGYVTPECLKSPYLMEQKREFLEERRMRHMPTESEIKKIKEKTPWSEYKRRFWKEALGDDYESPSQCYTANTQKFADINDSVAGTSSAVSAPRQLTYDPPEESEADKNLQKLNDFIKRNADANHHIENNALPDTEPLENDVPASEQHEVVGWCDPNDVVESTPVRHGKKSKVPCFMLTSNFTPCEGSQSDEIRKKLIDQIKLLNGKVCEKANYDESGTHLLCEKPSRTEKVLGCISAGKWVLHKDYIQKCVDAGRFIDEELYEFGNPKAMCNLPHLDKTEDLIGNAAHRSRKRITSDADACIFKDYRVILKTTKNENIRTLIIAGKGEVIEVDDKKPLHKQANLLAQATHVIFQPKVTQFSSDELNAIKQTNVLCVSMTYLNTVILYEGVPDPKPFLYK